MKKAVSIAINKKQEGKKVFIKQFINSIKLINDTLLHKTKCLDEETATKSQTVMVLLL